MLCIFKELHISRPLQAQSDIDHKTQVRGESQTEKVAGFLEHSLVYHHEISE